MSRRSVSQRNLELLIPEPVRTAHGSAFQAARYVIGYRSHLVNGLGRCSTPTRIKNELIVAVPRPRRWRAGKLVERMLASQQFFGIRVIRPSAACMSQCWLLRLHRKYNGTWGCTAGDSTISAPGMRCAESSSGARRSCSDTLFAPWRPCGVPDGLHPVLLCAFLQITVTRHIYRDGSFIRSREPPI